MSLLTWSAAWSRAGGSCSRSKGLVKAQSNRIERLQHRLMQFPSDAAAIVKQGTQSLLGCLEGIGEAASDLFESAGKEKTEL